MRLIGYLIITFSLIVGAIATTTAYVPRLTDNDDALKNGSGYAHLNAPAGAQKDDSGAFILDDEGERIAIVEAGTELTPDVQAQLRSAGVQRVRVKEFSFGRWQYAWLFGLAVVGLIAGGLIVKTDVKREIARHEAETDARPHGSPQQAVASIIEITHSLQRDLPGMASDEERAHAIIERLDHVQKELSMQVVDGRNMILGKLGLGGFAQFMDAFSRLERTLNRAWSAAADGVIEEAMLCINEAAAIAPDVESRLG